MKPNKPLQATLPAQTSTNTKQQEKCPQGEECKVENGDNPFRYLPDVKTLDNFMRKQKALCVEYRLRRECFDVLVRISGNWESGRASTMYSLCIRHDKGDLTSINQRVVMLLGKGLIQVVSYGKYGTGNYAPTPVGMELVKSLLTV